MSKVISSKSTYRYFMVKRRVVITGIGAVTPLGLSALDTWENALKGISGITKISKFDSSAFSSNIAGEVKNFDPGKFFDAKEVKKVDFFTHYSVAAAHEAMSNAGLLNDKAQYSAEKMGCILGVGIGGLSYLERNHEAYLTHGPRRISPFLIPAMITNMAPGFVAIKHGLKGVNFTIQSACTSSTHALGESYRMIKDGAQDVMVTGGAEAAITITGIGGFCALKALSTRNDEPERASRPFDKDRDGFVMSEGAVVLVLESLEGALSRGAHILAEIKGYGSSCDAFHMTAPLENGEGAIQCMTNALKDADLAPNQINYLNAHGTSTQLNDSSETKAIKAVFKEWAFKGLAVSSTKSVTGHLLGAAGAVEALFCAYAIKNSIIPPTINLDNPDIECDLDYVPHKPRKANIEFAMSNSFGFGGTNGTLVFSKLA
jgi:3-oxoacyl-[acyl-carrier-protein] synthase II